MKYNILVYVYLSIFRTSSLFLSSVFSSNPKMTIISTRNNIVLFTVNNCIHHQFVIVVIMLVFEHCIVVSRCISVCVMIVCDVSSGTNEDNLEYLQYYACNITIPTLSFPFFENTSPTGSFNFDLPSLLS